MTGGFGIDTRHRDDGRLEVVIICRRCDREEGAYSEVEIVQHALTGRQYTCPCGTDADDNVEATP